MELLILKENLFSDQKQVAGKLAPSLLVASSSLSFIHTLLKLHHLYIKDFFIRKIMDVFMTIYIT